MSEPFAIETSTVGLVLWNPTTENLDMQYAGVSLTLKAGDKRTYEIACARHLLNGYGPRGLTSLSYGSNEEQIGKDAIQRNHEFKKKQVTEYNQRNENRKMQGLGFLPPTETLKQYAIDLGLELLEPYTVRDEERKGISDTKKENESLKAEMAELREMMKALMSKKEEPKKDDSKWICKDCGEEFGHHMTLNAHRVKEHGAK